MLRKHKKARMRNAGSADGDHPVAVRIWHARQPSLTLHTPQHAARPASLRYEPLRASERAKLAFHSGRLLASLVFRCRRMTGLVQGHAPAPGPELACPRYGRLLFCSVSLRFSQVGRQIQRPRPRRKTAALHRRCRRPQCALT